MKFWLCITNEENWEVIREKNVWGVEERHRNAISTVKPGDKLLIYVMSTRKGEEILPPRVVAVYEAASEVFRALQKYSGIQRGFLKGSSTRSG